MLFVRKVYFPNSFPTHQKLVPQASVFGELGLGFSDSVGSESWRGECAAQHFESQNYTVLN